MEEAVPEKQQRIITGSSIKRKPLSNLTNLIPKPYHNSSSFSQYKNPKSATAIADSPISDSSTGSTQIRNPREHLLRSTPRTPSPDDWIDDWNCIVRCRKQTMLKTRRKKKAPMKNLKNNMENTDNMEIEVDGAEDALQSKLITDPALNNKKKKCSSMGISKGYVLPQDFINQQRAYFKEIDEYELQVEEESI